MPKKVKRGTKAGKGTVPDPKPEPESVSEVKPSDVPGPETGAATDVLFFDMMGPVKPKLTDSMAEAVEAVQKVLTSKRGDTDFKVSVALLKEAIGSDKKGHTHEATLMYLAAASKVADVTADPAASAKQKTGLLKKLPSMDVRIATALKDSRTLFNELDEDNSGTIDELEFEKLLLLMQMQVAEGQFAAIDKDGSGAIEYDEFVSWSAEVGLQQNHEAFQAGWCALQGAQELALVSELERMGLKQAMSAAAQCVAEAETRDKKRSEGAVGHSEDGTGSSTGGLGGREEAGAGGVEGSGHELLPGRADCTSSNDQSLAEAGAATDVLFFDMMGPVKPKLTDSMAEAVEAVQKVLTSKRGDTDFKVSVALLKEAIGSDKKGHTHEATLMYLAAASKVADVTADPAASAKQKTGLLKKLPSMDVRIATALKDSRTLFNELDEDNSGTIDELEFEKLLLLMQMQVAEGQFAAIDKDGSGAIEYDEFVSWSAEVGLQQNHEAFQAGWCALQGAQELALVSELERMGLKQAMSAAAQCVAEAETRDKKRSEGAVGHSEDGTGSSTGGLGGREEAGAGGVEGSGHELLPGRADCTSSNDQSLAEAGAATDVLFFDMMGPVKPKLTDSMAEAVEAVQKVLTSKRGDTDFKVSVALLKEAIGSDKKGHTHEATLMYLAAASKVADVTADPAASAKQKTGLLKKLPSMDVRIATALKDSRTLFNELDEDNSGTIDELEFEKLLLLMQMQVAEGQFAAIDKDGSGAIEYDEFVSWSAEVGLQQNHEAFQAGWCALQGAQELALVSELERMGLKQAMSAAAQCVAEAETRDKKRSEGAVGHSEDGTGSSTGGLGGREEAGAGGVEGSGHEPPSPRMQQLQKAEQKNSQQLVDATFDLPGPLGFSFSGDTGSILVVSIRPGSQADGVSQVNVGAELVAISTMDESTAVDKMPYSDVLQLLKKGDRPVTLSFRLPVSTRTSALTVDTHPNLQHEAERHETIADAEAVIETVETNSPTSSVSNAAPEVSLEVPESYMRGKEQPHNHCHHSRLNRDETIRLKEELRTFRETLSAQTEEIQVLKESAVLAQHELSSAEQETQRVREQLSSVEQEMQRTREQVQVVEEEKAELEAKLESVAAVASIVEATTDEQQLSPRARPFLELSGDMMKDRLMFQQLQEHLRSQEEELLREKSLSAVNQEAGLLTHEMERKMRAALLSKDAAHGAELRDLQSKWDVDRTELVEKIEVMQSQLDTARAELAAERKVVELLRKSESDLVISLEAKHQQEEASWAEATEAKLAEMQAEHLKRAEEMDKRLADVQLIEASLAETRAQSQLQIRQAQAALMAKDHELTIEIQGLAVKLQEKEDENLALEASSRRDLQRERERGNHEMELAVASMKAREENYQTECSLLREQLQAQEKETHKALESIQEHVAQALRNRETEHQRAQAEALQVRNQQVNGAAGTIVARRLAAAASAGVSRPLPPRLASVDNAQLDPIEARRLLRERLGLPFSELGLPPTAASGPQNFFH